MSRLTRGRPRPREPRWRNAFAVLLALLAVSFLARWAVVVWNGLPLMELHDYMISPPSSMDVMGNTLPIAELVLQSILPVYAATFATAVLLYLGVERPLLNLRSQMNEKAVRAGGLEAGAEGSA